MMLRYQNKRGSLLIWRPHLDNKMFQIPFTFSGQFRAAFHPGIRQPLHLRMLSDWFHRYNLPGKPGSCCRWGAKRKEWKNAMYPTIRVAGLRRGAWWNAVYYW